MAADGIGTGSCPLPGSERRAPARRRAASAGARWSRREGARLPPQDRLRLGLFGDQRNGLSESGRQYPADGFGAANLLLLGRDPLVELGELVRLKADAHKRAMAAWRGASALLCYQGFLRHGCNPDNTKADWREVGASNQS